MIQTITVKIGDEINAWIKTRKNFIGTLARILMVIILSLTCAFPHSAWCILINIGIWKNALILWMINFYFVIFYLYPICMKQYKKDLNIPLIYGIELPSIARYIIESGTFKRDEVVRRFGISRQVAQDIIDRLDEVGIFVRGPNNGRVVDMTLTEGNIVERLLSPTTENIEPLENSQELEKYGYGSPQTDWRDEGNSDANDNGFIRRPVANEGRE